MADILEEIVAHKRIEIEQRKRFIQPRQMITLTEQKMQEDGGKVPGGSMKESLMNSETGIMLNSSANRLLRAGSNRKVSRASSRSPTSRTEPRRSASSPTLITSEDMMSIFRSAPCGVTLPILYKNFVVEEYQLLQARYCGASAVLLIAACLTREECKQLMNMAHQLGMEVLLEMHNERDFEYAELEPDMYGINNRNLGTFFTDVENSFRLAEKLPKDVCRVSESGISNPQTVLRLKRTKAASEVS